MKVFIISLLVAGVVCEVPPYPASGWRPSGPAFELPQKTLQKQYLPPIEPRNPPGQYGPPEVDVSVQGLPTEEQLPIFQVSPVNGQQYVGPAFNSDIRSLDRSLQQSQIQQEYYRQFARQRQLEAAAQTPVTSKTHQNPPIPRQFVQKTTSTTPEPTTTTSTESFSLNQGEILEGDAESKKVEISKQRIQELNPQFLLSPLAQLQSQYAPLQLGQIQAPVFFQPATGTSQKQLSGYDAETHLAALPQIIAQQQLAKQLAEAQQTQLVQANQVQYYSSQFQEQQVIPQPQYSQPQYPIQAQVVQPQAFQPQAQAFQPQAQGFQPQAPQQLQPNYDQADQYYPAQPQFVVQQTYQPQPQQSLTPAQIYQQQIQTQGSIFQEQSQEGAIYPQQVQTQLFQGQSQEGLQSGFDVNQQGNGVEEEKESDEEGPTAVAVATAFGTRTQPRVPVTYGAPAPVPRQQDPQTGGRDEEETTPNPRRKSAKLRNRRIRPVFTLDNNGHLVLDQNM